MHKASLTAASRRRYLVGTGRNPRLRSQSEIAPRSFTSASFKRHPRLESRSRETMLKRPRFPRDSELALRRVRSIWLSRDAGLPPRSHHGVICGIARSDQAAEVESDFSSHFCREFRNRNRERETGRNRHGTFPKLESTEGLGEGRQVETGM